MSGAGAQIIVITHNGKMPKDGGRRFGYVCNDNFYPVGSTTPIPLSFFRKKEPAKPKAPEKPRISYYEFCDLSYARDYDGQCWYCGHSPNPTITVDIDGMGERRLVKCRCGRLMLPY